MTRFLLIFSFSLIFLGCEYNITTPSPVVTVTNTNTNTNTTNTQFDLHDLVTVPCSSGCCTGNCTGLGGDPTQFDTNDGTPLSIPASSEQTALVIAEGNKALVVNSCQDTHGVAAWLFLDKVVSTLRLNNQRWGYVCRDSGGTQVNLTTSTCTRVSGDTIGFRATNDNIGVWAIDIITNHCGPNPGFQWSVIGFDPQILWVQTRPN